MGRGFRPHPSSVLTNPQSFWLGAGPGAQCRRTVDVATRGVYDLIPPLFYRYRGAVWPGGKCTVQAAAAGKFFRPHPTTCIADLAE